MKVLSKDQFDKVTTLLHNFVLSEKGLDDEDVIDWAELQQIMEEETENQCWLFTAASDLMDEEDHQANDRQWREVLKEIEILQGLGQKTVYQNINDI